MTITIDKQALRDIGPAPTPPEWCLPGTLPNTDSTGEGWLWSWSREFGPRVWIESDDLIVEGRIVRTQPEIVTGDMRSTSGDDALELGHNLIEAGKVLNAALGVDR